jgi:hypothetical protein
MAGVVDELRDMDEMLTSGVLNSKKARLRNRFVADMRSLLSKYEYMYHKHILRNKKLNAISSEKERDLAIVQRSMSAFMPYILAYNLAQMDVARDGECEDAKPSSDSGTRQARASPPVTRDGAART